MTRPGSLHRQAANLGVGNRAEAQPDYLSLAFELVMDAVRGRLIGGSGEAHFSTKLDTIVRELEHDELLGRIPRTRKIARDLCNSRRKS